MTASEPIAIRRRRRREFWPRRPLVMFSARRERASDDQHAVLAGWLFAPPRSRRNQPIALLMMSTDLASPLILDRWSYQSRLNSKPARSTLMTTEPGSSHRSGTASVQTVDGRLWSPPAGGQLPTHIHSHGAIAVEVAPHRWLVARGPPTRCPARAGPIRRLGGVSKRAPAPHNLRLVAGPPRFRDPPSGRPSTAPAARPVKTPRQRKNGRWTSGRS